MRLSTYLSLLSKREQREFRRRLAWKAEVSGQTVSNWVCGRQRPSPEHARIIARESGGQIELEDLL